MEGCADDLGPGFQLALQAALSRVGMGLVTDSKAVHNVVAKSRLSTRRCFPGATCELSVSVSLEADGRLLGQGSADLNQSAFALSCASNAELPANAAKAVVPGVLASPALAAFAATVAPPSPPASAAPVVVAAAPAPASVPGTAQVDYISGTPQRNAYALIVGIDRYRDIPVAAAGALTDAERFAAIARLTLGVPDDHIRLATGDHASRSDFEKQLLWLKSNVPSGGRVYFYFAGHGAPDAATGASYLLPYDGDPRALESTALPLPRVLRSLSETQARDVLVVLDSCFSGARGRSVLPEGVRPLVHVREVGPTARVAVFAAARGAEISGPAPDGSGGLFSSLLAQGLGRGEADHDGDGTITLQELSEWVTGRVSRQARKDGREQTPNLVLGNGVTPGAFAIASGLGTR
jgi:hypothetical protein